MKTRSIVITILILTIIALTGCTSSIVKSELNIASKIEVDPVLVIAAGENINAIINIQQQLNGKIVTTNIDEVKTKWAQINGPGIAAFSDNSALNSKVSFSEVGEYQLCITAYSEELIVTDDLIVTVTTQNVVLEITPAKVDYIEIQNSYQLDGALICDQLPEGSELTIKWEKVSGPGIACFTDNFSLKNAVSFTTTGDYVLKLTAKNAQLSVSEEIKVTVRPTNLAPVVNAGADVIIAPQVACDLQAIATDDGWPNNELEISWEQVSGPTEIDFADKTLLNASVTFPENGRYVFMFKASDGVFTTKDFVIIDVAPDTTTDLFVHWDMDQTAGQEITDLSGNGNTGLCSNMNDSNWQYGISGNGLNFDGKDEIVSASLGDMEGPITISTWAYFNQESQEDYDFVLTLGKAGTENAMVSFTRHKNNRFYCHNGKRAKYGPALVGQEWMHIVAVYNTEAPYHRLFINGVEVEVDDFTAPVTLNGEFVLGAYYNKKSHCFDGTIDNVRVYKRTLLESEIEYLYSQKK
ncbi:LamG-like jellyroll fold domain-containing protein [Candidatus Margulisiibacteriota bacterium]